MTFVRYNSNSVKARITMLQEALNKLGYDLDVTGKRDKKTVKALMKFQKDNGIIPNGVVCERTFERLGI